MTTALTTNFEIPVPPLDTQGVADGYGTLMQAADQAIADASGLGEWTDYSGTSTITGWDPATFTSKHIEYKKVGNLMFVSFELSGTSNSASTEFSLPYANAGGTPAIGIIRAIDDGGAPVISYCGLAAADTVVGCLPVVGGGAWQNHGTKTVAGQFFYEVA